MSDLSLHTNDLKVNIPNLITGNRILLSGIVYTARDAAHKRLLSLAERGEKLPFSVKDAVIYYAGPTKAPSFLPIGSCGPTTSGRMDVFAPALLDMGLAAMIGKGPRSTEVINSIVKNRALYLCAVGGAGALYAKCVQECAVIAFEDLGCESIKRLVIKDFPLTVTIDCFGGNLFKI